MVEFFGVISTIWCIEHTLGRGAWQGFAPPPFHPGVSAYAPSALRRNGTCPVTPGRGVQRAPNTPGRQRARELGDGRPAGRSRLAVELPLKSDKRIPDALRAPKLAGRIAYVLVLQLEQRGELLLVKFGDALAHILPQYEIEEGS